MHLHLKLISYSLLSWKIEIGQNKITSEKNQIPQYKKNLAVTADTYNSN